MKPMNRADELLRRVERAQRGKLKVYLGYAAGVGKTYRMLEEAHALVRQGVDVVLGYIEPHDRSETIALLEGLEVVPRQRIDYRGVVIEEMNLPAILARRPHVAIVDELAHTNAPGLRNRKRYQDVLELLEAGIHVIAAFNIQHLESLNDLVSRAASVQVRETVPDTVLRRALVVNIDLSVDDLLARLKAGKIYAADKVPRTLAGFFKDATLSTLRELSLREVADSVEVDERPAGTAARVMVCMSSFPPHAATLLRRASRMAGRLSTDWFVVYVETRGESVQRIDAEVQRRLHANLDLARELGGEVVRLQGRDPSTMLLDFARSHGVGHIVIGRSHQPWWRQLVGRSVPLRLVREADGFDLHIVSFGSQVDE